MQPRTLTLAALLALAVALAACGKKGDLRPPDGEDAAYTYPKFYPDPKTVEGEPGAPASREEAEENLEQEADEVGIQRSPLLPSRTTTQTYGSESK